MPSVAFALSRKDIAAAVCSLREENNCSVENRYVNLCLAARRRRPKANIRKASATAGHKKHLLKLNSVFVLLGIHVAQRPSPQCVFTKYRNATFDTPKRSMRRLYRPIIQGKGYDGIARRAGRSPSEARKLPEQRPRSPRGMAETGKPRQGVPGGVQRGPRRGAAPNRPPSAARRAGGPN